ncbi:ABC transporter ATP-binding protein [Kribbella sp. NPDC050124]|uniref:ABC transporter ATP-binding protein n=1 Tax=Kribbella sp. NPDC050124 TaxID=3364114 RepID=UPI00378E1C2D
MEPLLEIDGLTVSTREASPKRLLDGISLRVCPGEVLAVVGESGSGKSLTALSIMQMLPAALSMQAERMTLDGDDLLSLRRKEIDGLHGGRIGMLFQQPRRMLDPTATVGSQVAEPLVKHLRMSHRDARRRVLELLADVGIDEPARRAQAYPHQLSGGLAQRVMIAIALAASPPLLIADEPTTALDVTVEAQILHLLKQKKHALGMSMLFISHDLNVVASIADRIAVMYAGRVVESGTADEILTQPEHPYTRALIECASLQPDASGQLYVIPGGSDTARDLDRGCRFRPRCGLTQEAHLEQKCDSNEPVLLSLGRTPAEHECRCWGTAEHQEGA